MIKDKRGFTLIELIIVIALLGVVILMGFSVLSFGYKSFNSQTDTTDNQSNVRYAMSDISKEIRRADPTKRIVMADGIINIDEDRVIYKLQGSTLLKNNKQFITGINELTPLIVVDKITLKITSQAKRGREFTLTSEIYVRK
ncbi:PilW family protein [Clostridium estertheticum]|uniref:PilW family protein n=1 Tax=Clostridium estertheticum TaxID=238834 RepID=UPI001CF5538C|nr:type II secretion system protein [Clostridium estertheticum]MCB2355923.1 type II secretion system GspH family protein [Clostridium estertheticum]WAG42305.1 type II secretion system GspH family protein [Clostridium estertheticum]